MSFDLQKARDFIATAEIASPQVIAQGEDTGLSFSSVRDQAAVVGQDVFAFVSGTDAQMRSAISSSALLAQLVADKCVADRDDVMGWYNAYFEVLRTIGWVVQESGWSEVSETGSGFEVHEKISEIAAVLLGGAPAALAVVASTLTALRAASEDSPWITLFRKRSVSGQSARFQISLVQPAGGSNLMVSMMAFALRASSEITQVLLFKVKRNEAMLRSNSAKVSINVEALEALAPDIREKVRHWQRSYINALPDLGPPPED